MIREDYKNYIANHIPDGNQENNQVWAETVVDELNENWNTEEITDTA